MSRADHSSTQSSITSSLLLEGLKDSSNNAVWQQYVSRYRPIIVQYGLRLGLSSADAEDAAQKVLVEFCSAYQAGKYDRQRGRLRDWLLGIARLQILNHRRRGKERGEVQMTGSGTQYFDRLPDEASQSAAWEAEWRNALMQQCLATVRGEVQDETYRAFEKFALQGRSAEDVAAELGTTANAIFSAKRRILKRIRELLAELETQW